MGKALDLAHPANVAPNLAGAALEMIIVPVRSASWIIPILATHCTFFVTTEFNCSCH